MQCVQALCTGIAAVSIVAVFFTPPVGSVFKQQSTVRSMNVLVAFFFTVDAVLKCLAYGVLLTPTAYLQVLLVVQATTRLVPDSAPMHPSLVLVIIYVGVPFDRSIERHAKHCNHWRIRSCI